MIDFGVRPALAVVASSTPSPWSSPGGETATTLTSDTAISFCLSALHRLDGENGTAVAAAVVTKGGRAIDVDDIRGQLRSSLSAYKIPKYIWVVSKSDLPFTDTGKIKRSALAELLEQKMQCDRPHRMTAG